MPHVRARFFVVFTSALGVEMPCERKKLLRHNLLKAMYDADRFDWFTSGTFAAMHGLALDNAKKILAAWRRAGVVENLGVRQSDSSVSSRLLADKCKLYFELGEFVQAAQRFKKVAPVFVGKVAARDVPRQSLAQALGVVNDADVQLVQ